MTGWSARLAAGSPIFPNAQTQGEELLRLLQLMLYRNRTAVLNLAAGEGYFADFNAVMPDFTVVQLQFQFTALVGGKVDVAIEQVIHTTQ